jgi:hypothetical protein
MLTPAAVGGSVRGAASSPSEADLAPDMFSGSYQAEPVGQSVFAGWDNLFANPLQPQINELIERDYSEYIAALPNGREAYGPGFEHFDMRQARVSGSVSEAEQKALYGYLLPESGLCTLPTFEIALFYYQHGRLPKDALELALTGYSGQSTESMAWALSGDAPFMQFSRIARFVSPISGKFYQSFDSPEWSPGGIYMLHLSGNPEPGEMHYAYIHSQQRTQSPVPDAWMLRVYGDMPGEVLLEQPLYYYTSEQWAELAAKHPQYAHQGGASPES